MQNVFLVHQKSPIPQVQLDCNHMIDNMITPLLSGMYDVTCEEAFNNWCMIIHKMYTECQDVYSMQNISSI